MPRRPACRPCALAGAVVLAALALLAAAPAARAEQRVALSQPEQARWAAVGRLTISGLGYCTATLVAPDRVLTAAHCVRDRRTGRPVAPGRLHFLAGYRAGAFAAAAPAAAVRLAPPRQGRGAQVGGDLALVRLARPLAPAIRPLAVGTGAAAEAPATVLSFGLDRAQVLSRQTGCRVLARAPAAFATDCEGVPGVSGAPLLQTVNGRLAVVGVASAVVDPPRRALPRGALVAVGVAGAAD